MASNGVLVPPDGARMLDAIELHRQLMQLVGRDLGLSGWGSAVNHVAFDSDTEYAYTLENQGDGGHLNVPGVLQVASDGSGVTISALAVTGNLLVGGTLDVTGAITGSSTVQGTRLISTIATGTAPLTVTSTTKVANLNVDLFDGLDSSAFALLAGAAFTGSISTTGNLTVQGNTALGNGDGDTLTVIGLSTFRNAANTATQLYVDAGNNRVQVGSATALSSASNSVLEVNLGRTYLAPNSESLALGLRYAPGVLGQVWLGASNSATPDLIVSNNAGTQTARMLNSGLLIVGTGTAAVSTAAAGDVQCNDVWLVSSGSDFRRLLANGSAFQISNNANSGTDLTIDASGIVTIKQLEVDTNGIEVAGSSTFNNSVTVSSGGIGVTGNSAFNDAVSITNGPLTVPATDPPTANGVVTAGSLCKAFARVTGSSGALGHNYNIASVTRNGAGDYSIPVDRDFSDDGYAVVVSVEDNGATVLVPKVNSKTSSSVDVHVMTTAGVLTDPDFFSVAMYGTLS